MVTMDGDHPSQVFSKLNLTQDGRPTDSIMKLQVSAKWQGELKVELRGIEPLTYSMRTSRATNCAIAPDIPLRRVPAPPTRAEIVVWTPLRYWPAACGRS